MAPDPQSREVRQQRFAHFTELAIVSVQEIVDFAKQLPGFLQLSQEDQIALLKTSAIEVAAEVVGRRSTGEGWRGIHASCRRSPVPWKAGIGTQIALEDYAPRLPFLPHR